MSRRLKLAAAVAIAALLLSGCGGKWNSPAIPELKTNEIIPLAVGNSWTYVDSTLHNGVWHVDSSRVLVSVHEVIGVHTVNQDAYDWTWVNPVTGAPDTLAFVLGTAQNGTYLYGARYSGGLYTRGRFLQFRSPVYLNDSWADSTIFADSTRKTFVDTTFNYTCSAPSTPLVTPAGTLLCIEYYYMNFFFYSSDGSHSHRSELYLYCKPGVGYVGSVEKLDGVIVRSKRLKSYTLQATSVGEQMTLPARQPLKTNMWWGSPYRSTPP